MKNKLCYVLLGILMSFTFMNDVFAATDVSMIVDETTVVRNSEVSIKINLKSDIALTSCLFDVNSDSDIEFISKSGSNNWNVTQDGVDGFLVENNSIDGDNLSNGKNILVLKYKVKGDGKVSIVTNNCINGTTEEVVKNIATTQVEFTVTEPVDDTSLKSINVTGGVLSPTFKSDKYSYVITNLSSPKFGLILTATDEKYQDDIVVKKSSGEVIENLSNITFKNEDGSGMMLLTITVADKTKYSITVSYTQKDLKSDLKWVTINGEQLELVDGVLEYEYKVGKNVSSFEVDAEVRDSNNFKIGAASNAPGTFTIKDSVDVIIVVEPKNSELGASLSTYTIRIVKEGNKVEDKPSGGNSGGTAPGGSSGGTPTANPETGDISMFTMAFILIASLVGSVVLYQKNLESYK